MSPLYQALDDYLNLRHAMGFKLETAGTLLPKFVAFLEDQGTTFITVDAAVSWATQPRHVQPTAWAQRLSLVRGFAQYHHAIEPRTEIPPPGLLPYRPQRHTPYLYSDDEIAQLMEATRDLSSPRGLRAYTYTTVFGLLASTGMRISELLALDNDDIDLEEVTIDDEETLIAAIPQSGVITVYAVDGGDLEPVPTVSAWGAIILVVLILMVGVLVLWLYRARMGRLPSA